MVEMSYFCAYCIVLLSRYFGELLEYSIRSKTRVTMVAEDV
jgi:hypothetical protein